MLHYHKFRQDLFDLQPGADVRHKPGRGKGWPEECPPIRAANGFGFDVLANFDVTFVKKRDGSWRVEPDVILESDFLYSPPEASAKGGKKSKKGASSKGKNQVEDASPGVPLVQQYAWFWEKGQVLPHVISDNVYEVIKNQVKVSTFLYLKTDPDELLMMGELPNWRGPWRVVTALIDTDWYPASYPWHTVLELDPGQKRIELKRGTPLCRITPVRRETYIAKAMSEGEFSDFFDAGQHWISSHGQPTADPTLRSLKRSYVKQQKRAEFKVRQ